MKENHMVRINDKGGLEYAIRRDDGRWLSDPDLEGDGVWETDADNATWKDTPEDAYSLAARFRLLDLDSEEDALLDGYTLMEREWVNEEDIDEDYENPPAHPYKG